MQRQTDAEIALELLPEARVTPLVVDFDHPEKDVQEARVFVNDPFSGRVQVDGIRATRSFSFSGDPGLFQLQTNPWSSLLPRGEIHGNRIVIGFEGRGDAESIKRDLDREEQTLREYVGNSVKQVERYNQELEAHLRDAVGHRRTQLASVDDLKGRI